MGCILGPMSITKAQLNEVIYREAVEAGRKAVEAMTPNPMVVHGHGQSYFVADGVCGFAWINVPGNSAFGKFLKKEKGCNSGYPKGINWWISDYNQSMQKKEAFAYAAAGVLQKYGIDARPGSRMD